MLILWRVYTQQFIKNIVQWFNEVNKCNFNLGLKEILFEIRNTIVFDRITCHEGKILIQPGQLIRVSLSKYGFRKSGVSLSRWSKCGQTVLLVAGHDPPSDITIYSQADC